MYSSNARPASETTNVKHKEEGSKRRELDRDDRLRILTELRKHSHTLTHPSDSLYNIVNGQVVSETEVNVQDAVAIGQDMRTSFASSLPGGFHHPIKKTVKTMQVLKRGVKIKGKTVYDLEAVFARLVIVGRNRNVDLADVFQHELCSVPPSLIDEYGCIRKGSKAVLVSRLGVTISNPPSPDTLLVDASQLLYHIVWPSSGTVGDLADGMRSRLINYNGVETYVIFDRYDGISAKDHERQRRAGEGSAQYQRTLTSPLAGRDAVMKNKANKRQLSQLLCTHDIGSNIELVSRTDSIVRHDEADISLISYILKAAAAGADIVRILSDDTDVFVLLVYWCKKADVSCAVQMERWNGSVLDINATVTALGDKCRGLLGMHALSGCDTVSYPNGRGKVSALQVLTQMDIDELVSVLGEERQTCRRQALHSFCPSTVRKKAPRWMLPGTTYTERGRIRLHWNRFPQPTRTWHCRDRICKCYYGRRRTSMTLQIYNWLTMAGKWRNVSTWCLPFLGSLLHHRSSWTSSAAAAKRRVKPVVEGVAVGLVDYRAPATVSVKEGIIAVIHILNRRRTKTSHSRATWILMILWGKRVTDWACDRRY